MEPLPHHYTATVAARSGVQSSYCVGSEGVEGIIGAIPFEFGGPGNGWSPEHFFVGGAASCLVAMFKVLAENSRLAFDDIQVDGDATLDRDEDGALAFLEVVLRVELTIARDRDHARAQRLLEKARSSSIFLRAFTTPVRLETTIASSENARASSFRREGSVARVA